MVYSYDELQGDPQDPGDHPSHNIPQATQHYAGDIVPIRPNSPTVNDYAADRQILNQRSISNIAKGGASSVDTTNLKLFPRK